MVAHAPAQSKSVFETKLGTSAAFAPNPTLQQCANGTNPSAPITCAGGQWQNGNLNGSNSHYIEGESVSYRITFTGLAANSTGNTVLIEWDTTEGGKHALDYLTSYDRTEAGSNPCSGVTGCVLGSPSTFAIPLDPNVSGGGVTQIAGQNFTIWGGTITGVSSYTLTGTYGGTSSTGITLTFDVGADPDSVVIAFGGHISTRTDWGTGNSAIALSGSPYHMRVNGGANRSLSVEGVIFPGIVTIIKEVETFVGGDMATLEFPFTATNFGTGSFVLVDMNSQPADRMTNANILAFGATNTITVTEGIVLGWTLADLDCVETAGGAPNSNNTTVNLLTRTASIIVEEGETVVCTFKNLQITPTSATASVSGQVLTESGQPIGKARITLLNTATSELRVAQTNAFGYYSFEELPVGNFYVLTVGSKQYVFGNNPRSFVLMEDMEDVNFTAGN